MFPSISFNKITFYFPYIYFFALMLLFFIKNILMVPDAPIWYYLEIIVIGTIFMVQAIKQFRWVNDILGIFTLFYSFWMSMALYADYYNEGIKVLNPIIIIFIVLNYVATILLFFPTKVKTMYVNDH